MSYDWNFAVIYQYQAAFWRGAVVTAELTAYSLVIGSVLGLLVALARDSSRWIISIPTGFFVETFRSTPGLVQLVWIYYCLPILTGISLSTFTTVVLAFALHTAAYTGEIFRAGIRSVDKGQYYAAMTIGMTDNQLMRRIILPQALRRVIPPYMNEVANLVKLTTLGSVLAVHELQYQASNLVAQTFRPLEILTFLAIMFAVIIYPMTLLSRFVEASYEKRK
jgi:polar amino acid transport system permease protein